jgi:peptidoglycan glycosyltransferase
LQLGAARFTHYANAFGWNKHIPFDLPTEPSKTQDPSSMDPVQLASASFGQGQDLATPLQMAQVAAAVANDGVVMRPYLVDQIQDYNGKVVEQFSAKRLNQAISKETAATLTEIMVKVVEDGTGTAAQLDGVKVAGKTGTAEVEGQDPHAWFICFAPANDPRIALAVLVENGGEGGRTAAPIARDVLMEALGL